LDFENMPAQIVLDQKSVLPAQSKSLCPGEGAREGARITPPIERLVRETRTTPGLAVSCLLDARRDSQGIKLIPERLKQIRPHRHSVLPPWNGTDSANQSQNQFLPAALANGFPNLEKSSDFSPTGCAAWLLSRTVAANRAFSEGAPQANSKVSQNLAPS